MERSEAEKIAAAMLDQLEPFSPTPAIWKAFQDYHNEISVIHGTEWSNMDVKVVESDKVPYANRIVLICFGLKRNPQDPNEQYKVEYAIMPLDDNGNAFAFLPARDE
jgi:hypothetical protein